METDEVARLQQLLQGQCIGPLAAARDHHLHPKSFGQRRHLAANASATADEAQSLTLQLEMRHLQALVEVVPIAFLKHAHLRHQRARKIQDQGEDQVRYGITAVRWAVANSNALRLCSSEIHVVEARPCLLNETDGGWKFGDDVSGHRNLLGDDDVLTLHPLQDFFWGGVGLKAGDVRHCRDLRQIEGLVEVQTPGIDQDHLRLLSGSSIASGGHGQRWPSASRTEPSKDCPRHKAAGPEMARWAHAPNGYT
mmetsp:Transcript_55839/g.130390  ORF Transcript_55839/g.130390 Transcript_55839/m.130390 type:complete len:252 (+) Transcript_55839:384-1139(+)